MNTRQQNLRIGVFAVSGVFLMLAGLFYLGLSDIFTEKLKVFTYFTESAQGVSVGSQVKYRGVPVGSVTELSIDMDSKKVLVAMEIEPEYFHSVRWKGLKAFQKMFRSEVKNGLRCRLEFAGITGMKFIEMDYFVKPEKSVPEQKEQYLLVKGSEYIPSVPSTIRDLSGTLSNALERFSNIRFEEIAVELERSLSRLSELLSDPAIRSAISRINDAAENLEVSTSTMSRVLNENRLNRLMDSLEKDLHVIENLGEQISSAATDMKLPESTATIRNAIHSLLENREDFTNTLTKLNQTLESIKMLTDYLNANPSALIKGKQNPADNR